MSNQTNAVSVYPKHKELAPNQTGSAYHTRWVLSLFGTAVGAGILFLPMNAGQSGLWPLFIMTCLVGPMTYFSHRGLALLVLSGRGKEADLTQVATEYFGKPFGFVLNTGYFLAIYPILLIYGVSLTNTAAHYLEHQFSLAWPRWLLSLLLVSMMTGVMLAGEKIMLKVTQFLVYPLIFFLFVFSVLLIPQWHLEPLLVVPDYKTLGQTLWLTLPVLVFSFNHSPAVSSFVIAQKRQNNATASMQTQAVLKRTAVCLLFFVMFFVYSCVLAIPPAQLAQAKLDNVSVLSLFVGYQEGAWINHLAPLIAIVAIVSSYFGHYLGAREGLNSILLAGLRGKKSRIDMRHIRLFTTLFLFITVWGVAIYNPSILSLIESFVGPIIACILFLLPMYATYKVPTLKKYRNNWSSIFIILTGTIVVSAMLASLRNISN